MPDYRGAGYGLLRQNQEYAIKSACVFIRIQTFIDKPR